MSEGEKGENKTGAKFSLYTVVSTALLIRVLCLRESMYMSIEGQSKRRIVFYVNICASVWQKGSFDIKNQ